MAKRGGIESMSELALIDLLETGESMNYSESRETIEKLIADKKQAREKREAETLEKKKLFEQSPACIRISEQQLQSAQFRAETAQFFEDQRASGGEMTPEQDLRASDLLAKGEAVVARSKAARKTARDRQQAMRQAYSDEVEKTRAAIKDDPGPRG